MYEAVVSADNAYGVLIDGASMKQGEVDASPLYWIINCLIRI